MLMSGLAAMYTFRRNGSAAESRETRAMLAVLPFENLSEDDGQEYFADGLTEEMTAQLGQLQPAKLGVDRQDVNRPVQADEGDRGSNRPGARRRLSARWERPPRRRPRQGHRAVGGCIETDAVVDGNVRAARHRRLAHPARDRRPSGPFAFDSTAAGPRHALPRLDR